MQKIFLETQDDNLIREVQSELPDYQVVSLSSGKELSRLEHLREASNGSVLYSSNPESRHYPMYIGAYVSTDAIEPALSFIRSRLDSIPVGFLSNFIGGIQAFPRDLIILANNKKTWEEEVRSLLNVLPENFWGTVGFASVNNADKLSELYNDIFYYSTILAGDESSKKKLDHVGVEYVDISSLSRDTDGGLWVRELTRRPETWETKDIDLDFKREE